MSLTDLAAQLRIAAYDIDPATIDWREQDRDEILDLWEENLVDGAEHEGELQELLDGGVAVIRDDVEQFARQIWNVQHGIA
jgi:hypothetical protein